MNNNMDMKQLINMLSKMDKNELENGLKKLNYILNTKGADQIINDLKKNKN